METSQSERKPGGVRRALFLATAEQYIRLVANFVVVAAISRLLTSQEIGISVIGTGVAAIFLSVRAFATSDYLIQCIELREHHVRTCFTLLLLVTAPVAAALAIAAPWIARLYGEGGLALYIQLLAVAAVIECVSLPINALMRRDMEFGILAFVNIATVASSAALTLALALLGFSFLSLAWAGLFAAVVTTVMSLWFRPDLRIFRPSLRFWRATVTFGGYQGVTTVLGKAYESLPQLVLGRILPLHAVGLYNRASVLSGLPDRIILAGIFSVAYPALASELRGGRDLKQPYLRALSYITVVYWPAQLLLTLLARPVVEILLGSQWLEIVPVLQLMSVASFFFFPTILTGPVLVAMGAVRDALMVSLISLPASALILCGASFFGVEAMAASQLIALPLQAAIGFHYIRRHVRFEWRELAESLTKSAGVTLCCGLAAVSVLPLTGFRTDLSLRVAVLAGILGALGWLAGLLLTRHPFLFEIIEVLGPLQRRVSWLRMLRLRARGAEANSG